MKKAEGGDAGKAARTHAVKLMAEMLRYLWTHPESAAAFPDESIEETWGDRQSFLAWVADNGLTAELDKKTGEQHIRKLSLL